MNWLIEKVIRKTEAEVGEDCTYMREIASASVGGFWRFLVFALISSHRRRTPPIPFHLARLGAVQAEDCGPCLRIVVRDAAARGVPKATIDAALKSGEGLSAVEKTAFDFGRAVALASPELGPLGDALEAAYGRAVRTECAVAAAMVRVYPAVKRGLGLAGACIIR